MQTDSYYSMLALFLKYEAKTQRFIRLNIIYVV